MLDSAAGEPSPWSRWNYRLGPASRLLRCDSRTLIATLQTSAGEYGRWEDPLAALRWMADKCDQPAQSTGPPFKGGWCGYLSYDLGRLFEKVPTIAADDGAWPLFAFTYHDRVIAWDAKTRFDCGIRNDPPLLLPRQFGRSLAAPVSAFSREQYQSIVQRGIEYIRAGDIFQVNLAQRFTAGLPADPLVLYERQRQAFPAWFGAYLDFGDHALISNSPELFLRVTPGENGRKVITRPIKGTRGRQDGEDQALLRSAKDQAELNMIIDLQRNDLGRVCETGSVKVSEARHIESHATVYHAAATVEGVLRSDVGFVDLLRATFPGGSVTGAPKVRAMEIIEELEPFRRGPYCGAIGYLSLDGHIEFNMAIRTMLAIGDWLYFSVGAGIVADSDPAAEYEETMIKAKAMFAALPADQKRA
jgi:para-aminobenzoate synthetase component 1